MGLLCSKSKVEGPHLDGACPFDRFVHRNSHKRPKSYRASPGSLLDICLDAVVESFPRWSPSALRRIPPDVAQLLLDRLIETETLNDAAVLRLQGQLFFELHLDAYPEPIREFWIRGFLATEALEVLDLSRTQITDSVLDALPSLPCCKALRLDYCPNLTNAGASVLGRMPALEELSVAGCDGFGSPIVPWIAKCKRLRRLECRACHQMCGLRPLQGLAPTLEVLDVGWCNALRDDDAAAIGLLWKLKELRICHTSITNDGIASMASLSQLTLLSLGGLPVADVEVAKLLPCLKRLQTLDLNRCIYVGDKAIEAAARACLPLGRLNLAYTDCADRCIIDSLSNLPTLRELCIESCAIGDQGVSALASLQGLENLDVSDTDITNSALVGISYLPKLSRLDLSFTGIDSKGIYRLGYCTALTSLNLDCRDITDASLDMLWKLSSLESLSLFGTAVTDNGCSILAKCSSLKTLEACSGVISDRGVARLCALTGLRHLSLAQNWRISNLCVESLMRLEQLTSLNLGYTRVSSSGILPLARLPSIQVLGLSGTRVRPQAVDHLQEINPSLEVKGIKGSR